MHRAWLGLSQAAEEEGDAVPQEEVLLRVTEPHSYSTAGLQRNRPFLQCKTLFVSKCTEGGVFTFSDKTGGMAI